MALGPKELFHFLREMTADKWETSHQRGSSTTNTNKQKPGAASKTSNKGKKDQCQKMPPKQPRVDEVSTSIGKEDELSGVSTTNTNKPKPGAARKTNNKEEKVKAPSKKVPIEKAGDDQDLVTQQPSTSGSGRPQFKQGTPSDDELEHLAAKLGGAWKKLGRRLGIKDPKLEEIRQSNEALSEKEYQMLRHWKGINGSAATYQILGQAL